MAGPKLDLKDFVERGIITVSPEFMSGTPVFTGTRVPVKTLFDHLAAGDSFDILFADFPDVSWKQVSMLLTMIGEEVA